MEFVYIMSYVGTFLLGALLTFGALVLYFVREDKRMRQESAARLEKETNVPFGTLPDLP